MATPAHRTQLGLAPAPQSWRPAIGARLGDAYLLVREIGRGGIGQVWEAEQLDLRRRVAVKILDDDALSTVAMQRFVREIHALSDLRHPHLVPVLDAGWVEGRPYLVMPLLRGHDLGTELDVRGCVPAEEVVALLEGPAAALDALHRAGRVHRDIKPENLFVSRNDDGVPFVQILDFGLTTLMGDDRRRITREGVITGTPEYLSPEGAVGDRPDRRGDVYSLAVVAFELLTGRLPFDAERRLQLLVDKVEQDPPTLASVGVTAPSTLEEAMAHGLARDPEARFERASAFVRALRRGVSDGPVQVGVATASIGADHLTQDELESPVAAGPARRRRPSLARRWAPAPTPRDITHTRIRTVARARAPSERERLESARTVEAVALPRPDGRAEGSRMGLLRAIALVALTALVTAAVAVALLG